jgi:hypothetical protein
MDKCFLLVENRAALPRTVQLQRDQNGFGFILRGAKCTCSTLMSSFLNIRIRYKDELVHESHAAQHAVFGVSQLSSVTIFYNEATIFVFGGGTAYVFYK